ncbi:MAG TPA: protein kinase, partial [Ktedonobacteraceae bacterium]|nr:protein kinase [Ktedonobacteraceae bacterium]
MVEAGLEQIGPYTNIRLLNESSTARTYLGKHRQRKKYVVLKVFHTPFDTSEARETFLAHAKKLKKLKHRSIAEIQDAGFIMGTDGKEEYGYHVIQYVLEDEHAQRFAVGEQQKPVEVKRIVSIVADALNYAHQTGILHSNIHPSNLLFAQNNDILLTDFAPMPSAHEQNDVILVNSANRAFPYMAPEQLRGMPVAVSDQYSLAVMVFEWLCGRRPYMASEPETLLQQQEHEALPLPQSFNSDISSGVEQVLLRALALHPEDRFPTIQKFADAYLRALMGIPIVEERGAKNKTSAPAMSQGNVISSNQQEDRANTSAPKQNIGDDIKDERIKNLPRSESDKNKGKAKTQLTISTTSHNNNEDVDTHRIEGNSSSITIICRFCGIFNRTNAKYCLSCGKNLQTTLDAESINKTEIHASGQLLDQRYRILARVGQGAYGAVYKAIDTRLDLEVAVKEMIQDHLSSEQIAEATRAFNDEASLLSKLKHPNIPKIYDHFSDLGRWYLVMSFINGETLEDYLNKRGDKRLSIKEVLNIGKQLCAVLDYLHTQEPIIIFRDLKPANIMRKSDGRICLIDFGIARHFKPGKAKDTASLGTMGYAPPEQFGKAQTTTKSDIYSLGATLHQLLSGNDPGDSLFDFAPLHLGDQPALNRLETLIAQMTNRDISKRPESIAVIFQELQLISKQLSTSNTSSSQHSGLNGDPHRVIPGQLVIRASEDTIHSSVTEAIPYVIPTIDNSVFNEQDSVSSNASVSIHNSHISLHETVTADLRQGGILSSSLPDYEERMAQVEMARLVAKSLTEERPAVVEAATGTGKALDVDTPIPTPSGWKRMGDLVEGDFVFDEKGYPTRVTAAFQVMYDHKCYEVEFSDGSSIVADAEHEWISFTAADRKRSSQLLTSTYMAKNFVTLDQLTALDQLIARSPNDSLCSAGEATRLIGGHHWSVDQEAAKMAPINSGERPARYPRQMLLTAVRSRLERDFYEQRRDGRTCTLVTTEKMAATLTVGSHERANHAIPVASPLVLPDADLPIAPYFLGAWLGDGNSRNNQITTADPTLLTEIEKDGYTVRPLKGNRLLYAVDDENGKATSRWQPGMTGRLRALGLYLNKHIPTAYLRASEQQRRALLAGLLDTDGTVNHCGAVEFTTTSPQLAQGIFELVCSLGFRPSLRSGRARLRGKDCGPKWTLAFTTNEQVFRLERKTAAQKECLSNYSPKRNRFRYVVAVREVPSRPVRCIQVDSESHLYLAGRSMIPTHNSLAYLIPIVRSGKVAIISTANKALQEQLYFKDIPFVQKHIQRFDAALVKGMANYVCLDRLEEERNGIQHLVKNRDFMRLVDIVNDPDAGFTGDFETLSFPLPADIRSKVYAERDQCTWGKCSFFSDCYVRKMKVKAGQAKVIVVNHTLLLIDAELEGFLLPDRDVIVVDEAHHLEEEATRVFTVKVNQAQVATLLAQRLLKDHSSVSLQDEAKHTAEIVWERLSQVADPGYKGRANLVEPLEEGLGLAKVLDKLANSLRQQRPKNMTEKEDQTYDMLITRTKNLAANMRTVFSADQPDKFVYYVERINAQGRRGGQLEVLAAPLEVSSWLKEKLFDKYNVICTSATLATIGPNPLK